jgi:two-component system, NarL family, invasion response regulator UvrY
VGSQYYGGCIRVLVVDDHEIVRRGIVSTLEPSAEVCIVGEAASGERAIQMAHRLLPDIILMDLRMPGIGGLEAARRITIALPAIRVIAVTAWDAEPTQRLRQSGIAACIGKNVNLQKLEEVILRVRAERNRAQEQGASTRSPFDTLTSREMQVCSMLLAGERAPAIATRLFITPKTVHTYRYRIFERLGVNGDVELTKLAAVYGLVGAQLPVEPAPLA